MAPVFRLLGPLATVLLLTGCATTAAHQPSPSSTAAPACTRPPAGVLPRSAGSLTETDSGTYCLGVGRRIDIFLTAVAGSRWSPVRASDHTVVSPGNTGVFTPPVGVTPAMYIGTAPGSTVLTSATPSGHSWRVTLVVTG